MDTAGTDEHSATFRDIAENEAALPDLMAHFYPQDLIGDLGILESDPTLLGSTW